MAQCYIYTIVTGFWLVMVIVGSPLKSKAGFVIFVFNQAVRLVLGIFAAILATNDSIYFFLNWVRFIFYLCEYQEASQSKK